MSTRDRRRRWFRERSQREPDDENKVDVAAWLTRRVHQAELDELTQSLEDLGTMPRPELPLETVTSALVPTGEVWLVNRETLKDITRKATKALLEDSTERRDIFSSFAWILERAVKERALVIVRNVSNQEDPDAPEPSH